MCAPTTRALPLPWGRQIQTPRPKSGAPIAATTSILTTTADTALGHPVALVNNVAALAATVIAAKVLSGGASREESVSPSAYT